MWHLEAFWHYTHSVKFYYIVLNKKPPRLWIFKVIYSYLCSLFDFLTDFNLINSLFISKYLLVKRCELVLYCLMQNYLSSKWLCFVSRIMVTINAIISLINHNRKTKWTAKCNVCFWGKRIVELNRD